MVSWVATLIRIIHYLLLIFAVFTPLLNNEFLLTLHFMAMPTLICHWITNQNICSLTLLEANLRGINCDKTFMADVLYPFFSMGNDSIIYTLAIGLWLITIYKLYYDFDFDLLIKCFNVIKHLLYTK